MKSLKSCLGVIVVLGLLTCVSGFIVYQVSDFAKEQSSKPRITKVPQKQEKKESPKQHILATFIPTKEYKEMYLLVRTGEDYEIHYGINTDNLSEDRITIHPVTWSEENITNPLTIDLNKDLVPQQRYEFTMVLKDPNTNQISSLRPNGDYWKLKRQGLGPWGYLEIWDSDGRIGTITNMYNYPEGALPFD